MDHTFSSPTRRLARWLGHKLAHFSYARHIEPTWLEVNHMDVPIVDLHEAFAGTRIAHLTDIHLGHQLPIAYLQESLDRTLAQKPDLIAITGDFVHRGYSHVQEVARHLRQLQAPLGVYAVLGNHDFSVHNALGIRRYRDLHQAIAKALSENGIHVLRNQTVPLQRSGAQLLISGLDDLWSRECDPDLALRELCPTLPRVILAHNPQTVHHLKDHRCDLMLSGHTHGGQIHWPGWGPVFLAKSAKQFAAGLYRHQQTHLYVNKGIGFGWKWRYGVRPEIAVLTLQRSIDSYLS